MFETDGRRRLAPPTWTLLAGTGLAFALCPGTVSAQTATPPRSVPGTEGTAATPAPGDADGNKTGSAVSNDAAESNGDILVTARKRAESIADVPLAVSALTADALSARGIISPTGLNDFVPGFRLAPQGNSNTARSFNTFVIRGLNAGSQHPDRQNVGVFIDGISIGGAGGIPGLANVERVEVVKGPQSAYFGRATFGGAVNYITKVPSLFEYSGGIDVSLTSRQSVDQRGYIEGPIVRDVLSVRLDGERNLFNSGYKNYGYGGDLGDQKTESYSATVLFKPVDFLRVRGFYTAWRNDDDGNATLQLLANSQNCNARTTGTVTTNNYYCGGIDRVSTDSIAQNNMVPAATLTRLKAADQVLGSDFPPEFGLQRKAHFGYVNADVELPHGFTLSGYYGWQRNRFQLVQDSAQRYETAGRTSFNLTAWDIDNQVAEARLTSDASRPLKVMIGYNYFQQHTFVDSFALKNNVLTTALAAQRQATNTYGIFGSISYDITDRLTVSAEGRRQIDKIDVTIGTNRFPVETTSFTPRGIIEYKLTSRLNIYASYAKGTRPAQVNSNFYSLSAADQARATAAAGSAVPLAVAEEKIEMAEGGLRGNLFDNKVTILAAAYYGWWSDRQAQQTIAYNRSSDNALTSVIALQPNGRVNLYGVEAEITARPTRELTLEGTFAYAKTDIRYSVCTECAAINNIANNVGNSIAGYAPYTGSAAATYRRPIDDTWNGFVRADYVYTGRIYATEANIAYLNAGNRVNLRTGFDSEKYKIELFVTNLLDDKTPLGIARSTDTYTSANILSFTPPPLRTIGVRFAVDF